MSSYLVISSYMTISGRTNAVLPWQLGVVGMDHNYTSPEFLEDDFQASAGPLNGDQSTMNEAGRANEGLSRAAASGSNRLVNFTVAKVISAFELSILVLTGRDLTLVERSSDQ